MIFFAPLDWLLFLVGAIIALVFLLMFPIPTLLVVGFMTWVLIAGTKSAGQNREEN